MSAADELEVGCGRRGLRGRGLRPGGLRRAERGHQGRQEHRATRHEIELFHAAGVLTRAGAAARRPLRDENPAGAAAAHRRRGVHDAGRHRHPRRLPRRRDHLPRRARGRAGRAGPSRHRRRAGGAPPARLAADRGRPGARPRAAPRPLRPGRRLPRRAARVVPDLGHRRAAPGRLRGQGTIWMYTEVVPRPAGLRPRHSVENQWDLLPHLGRPVAAAPDRVRHRVPHGRISRRPRRRWRPPGRRPASARRTGSSSSTSAPATRSAAGPRATSSSWLCDLRRTTPIGVSSSRPGRRRPKRPRAIVARRAAAAAAKARRIASGPADEYTLAELRSLVGPGRASTSAGTAVRCMSRPRRTCR